MLGNLLFILLTLIPVVLLGEVRVKIKGLVCPSCAIGIKKHLFKTNKVDTVTFNVDKQLAYIYCNKDKYLTDKEITKAIDNAGYKALKITRHEEEK